MSLNDRFGRIFRPDCLQGTRIFVTGASSGLGRAAAVMLSHHGARLTITGRSEGRLAETLASLSGEGHQAITASLDDQDAAHDLIRDSVGDAGLYHGFFHAAGIFSVLPAKLTKRRQMEEVFASSIPAAYAIARAASQRRILGDGGSVVFMSSVAAVRGNAGLAAYSGAKAAILGLNAALARELAPRRIRVNALVAGTIETEMHLRYKSSAGDGPADENEAKHLLGYGRPEDIAYAVLFLMSDASRWMTGTGLVIDGGHLV